jgi:hypothetical protein
VEQSRKPFPEIVTKKQFINEWRSIRSTNILPWLIWLSQQMKV